MRRDANSIQKGKPEVQKSARPGKVVYVAMNDPVQPLPAPPQPKVKKKHSWKGLKITGMAAAMAGVCAASVYGGMTYYYSGRFFEGTTINGIDCSGLTAYEAEEAIAKDVEDYEIEIHARNVDTQTISGDRINYKYASQGEVLKLLKEQKPYEWPTGLYQKKSYTITTKATFDKKMLQEEVRSLDAAQEENQVAPENAYVAYQNDQFEIVPETEGSELILKSAYQALSMAITDEETSIDLGEQPSVYAQADLTSDSEELQETVEAYNNLANASITYTFGDIEETLDGSTIRSWLSFDGKGQLIDDEASFREHARQYVADLASRYDTVGTERPFNATSGRTVYVYGSAYGWLIDQAAETEQLIQDIRHGGQTRRDPVYMMTANSHGYNDFGDTYIEVDLSFQYMYYYRDGALIFDSPIVSGTKVDPSRATPSGVYKLYSKSSPAVLRGPATGPNTYEYETHVTYWMPFNGGIGFHDATWQPYFGGDRYVYFGSHGCINLPYNSAAMLYQIIDYNVPIICFY